MLNIITYLTKEDLEDIVPKNPVVLKLVFLCYGIIGIGYMYYNLFGPGPGPGTRGA